MIASQTENEVRIKLYDQQYDFFMLSGYSAFIGGIGSGKTMVGAVKTMQKSSESKTTGIVVAPTYPMLRDATLETFLDVCSPVIKNFSKSDYIGYIKGGSKILFRSADNPERLRGPNLDWAWIDEAGLCRDGTWEILLGRLRAHGKSGDLWITSTPKGKNNWLYRMSSEMSVIRATTMDNPYVSRDWVKSLQRNYSGNFLRQEVYGEFVSFEGLVYDTFDKYVHVPLVERDLNDFDSFSLAVDEGYTNPAVVLKIFETGDGEYYVAEEWYKRGKLHSEIAEQAYLMSDGLNPDVVVDSSAAGLKAEIKKTGLNVHSSSGRVLDGIQVVHNLLKVRDNGKPRLTINPSCVNLINEFESYIWKEGKDEPVKEFDHALDCLRYDVTRKKIMKAKQSRY